MPGNTYKVIELIGSVIAAQVDALVIDSVQLPTPN